MEKTPELTQSQELAGSLDDQ
jgi:hypothetical protein